MTKTVVSKITTEPVTDKGFNELLTTYGRTADDADEKLADQFGTYNTWYLIGDRLSLNAFFPNEIGLRIGEKTVMTLDVVSK